MSVARVIYFSSRIETYADAITALLIEFPKAEKIEIVFTDNSLAAIDSKNSKRQPEIGTEQEQITQSIRAKLISNAKLYGTYRKAEKIPILPVTVKGRQLYKILKDSLVIDISATPKEMAINVVTAAIAQGRTPVCSHRWIDKIDREKEYYIGINEHRYENLTNLTEARRLGRFYRANIFIVYFIALSVFILAIVSSLSYWFPKQFAIASQILNSLGIIIGFASLWLATRSVRDD